MDCNICATPFNQSTRAKINCFSCDFKACKECIRTYLLKTCVGLPKCMNCKIRYSTHFMVRHLNRSWVLNTYKETMTNVLTNVEMSKLPDTQPYVEAEHERTRLVKQNRVYTKEIEEMKRKVTKLSNAVHANQFRIRGDAVPPYLMNEFVDSAAVISLDVRKKFIMSCPIDACRGFLSTQYKCGTCQSHICSDCLTKQEDEHVCVESDKLTAEMIKKETKPCPKCGTRIYKIDGCDQMYCTSQQSGNVCGTAFSWKTGTIETGQIHNPHYYELTRNGMNLRNVGDIQCGGMPDISVLLRMLRNLNYTELSGRLTRIHRRLMEHIQYTANQARLRIQQFEQESRKVRVSYMMNAISKEEFSAIIYKQEKDHQKGIDIYHIYELISISGIEAFHGILRDFPRFTDMEWRMYLLEHPGFPSIDIHLKQLDLVREYSNEQLKQVSITYHCTIQEMDDLFRPVSMKYNMNGDKKK
jgi:hypothetical protein